MRRAPRRFVAIASLLGTVAAPAAAQRAARLDSISPPALDSSVPRTAPLTHPTRGRRFYSNKSFGSEAQFNPLSELVNEGFNDLVIESTDMKLFAQPYGAAWTNLWHNLTHVRAAVGLYGTRRLLRNELLPLSGFDGGQWLLNYTDHLIGNGMISVRLEEWFTQHGYRAPLALSIATMTGAHVLNEVIERPRALAVDPLADLLVFDPLGMLVFRSDWVQRAFSGRVRLTSWTGQPMLTFPTAAIENANVEFVYSFPLARDDQWRGIVLTGLNVMGGVRRDLGRDRGLSFVAGRGSDVLRTTDSTTDTRTVTLGLRAGVYYDREGSLLASLLLDQSRGGLFVINVYPGNLRIGGTSPGLWLNVRRDGVRLGFAALTGLGVGFGRGSPEARPRP